MSHNHNSQSIYLNSLNYKLNKNQKIEVPFYFNENNLIGFQCAIKFDPDKINLLEITYMNFGPQVNLGRHPVYRTLGLLCLQKQLLLLVKPHNNSQ